MPFLVEAVKNDSFPLPMTTGSENPDFYDLTFVVKSSRFSGYPNHVCRCCGRVTICAVQFQGTFTQKTSILTTKVFLVIIS